MLAILCTSQWHSATSGSITQGMCHYLDVCHEQFAGPSSIVVTNHI